MTIAAVNTRNQFTGQVARRFPIHHRSIDR